MMEAFWFILALLIIIEVGYQVVNLVVKKLNNIPIPGSAENEEEE